MPFPCDEATGLIIQIPFSRWNAAKISRKDKIKNNRRKFSIYQKNLQIHKAKEKSLG